MSNLGSSTHQSINSSRPHRRAPGPHTGSAPNRQSLETPVYSLREEESICSSRDSSTSLRPIERLFSHDKLQKTAQVVPIQGSAHADTGKLSKLQAALLSQIPGCTCTVRFSLGPMLPSRSDTHWTSHLAQGFVSLQAPPRIPAFPKTDEPCCGKTKQSIKTTGNVGRWITDLPTLPAVDFTPQIASH